MKCASEQHATLARAAMSSSAAWSRSITSRARSINRFVVSRSVVTSETHRWESRGQPVGAHLEQIVLVGDATHPVPAEPAEADAVGDEIGQRGLRVAGD